MARNVEFIPQEKVEKALHVFWQKGYHATSMQDLVDAMQINRSSLYNSFQDKHSLFLECLRSYAELSRNAYEAVVRQQGPSALQALDLLIDHVVEMTVQRENSCLSVKSCFEMAGHDPEVQRVLRAAHTCIITLLQNLLTAAEQSGEINLQDSPEVVASYISNSFCGWWQSHLLFQDPALIRKMAGLLKAHLRT
ncbi:TetR/AcrR family transcriptional regulator [Hymenobacter sp. YC55]|uniref:TetR/AcrR family transcriptional regulator n=1 Tax=Hymenobacter sp. YC55 TaxID=3034019 RepID=UPI0023F63C5B|nr:TetR/AcrR family transcriptional regulator [Hymenobacter sp. YC55]MDF7814765.1 TetR/AcrR family transcriptional regulator [Hymenobacter sp. YC55]